MKFHINKLRGEFGIGCLRYVEGLPEHGDLLEVCKREFLAVNYV